MLTKFNVVCNILKLIHNVCCYFGAALFFFWQWMPLPVTSYWLQAPYLYTLDIYTGYEKNAGTKSMVYVILIGDNGESPVIELKTEEREVSTCKSEREVSTCKSVNS